MNRSLKSARPDSSTYSTSRRIAWASARSRGRQRGDLGPLAGDVAGGHDPRQRQLGHEPDPDRAQRRQVGAEAAGQQHLGDLVDPRRRDRAAGSATRWRSRPWRTGARARRAARGTPTRPDRSRASGARTRAPRRSPRTATPAPGERSNASSTGMNRPEWSSSPLCTSSATASTSPEPHMPDRLDVADHLQRQRIAVRRGRPRSRRRRRASRTDLGRLERGAGGRRGGQHPFARAERDLAVGADVDEQPQPPVAGQAGGQHPGDDVAADVRAQRGEHERRAPAGGSSTPKSRARYRRQRMRGDDERRHRQRLGVDPERQRHHRHVAADGDLVDLARRRPRPRRTPRASAPPCVSCARSRSAASAVGIHHRRRDPGDHVGAVGLLAVEHRAHRHRLAAVEIEQRRHHRRRPEVERDREPPRGRVARLDVDQLLVDRPPR